ncbi:hypothetical protein D1872_308440 [compost metagenome]
MNISTNIKHIPTGNKDINLVTRAKIQTEFNILHPCHFRLLLCMITALKRHIRRIGMGAIDLKLHAILIIPNQIHIMVGNGEPAVKINAYFIHEAASPVNT